MFSVSGAAAHNEMNLNTLEFSPVRWLEGIEMDGSAPEYLMLSQRYRRELDNTDFSTLEVKIGDLGGYTTHLIFYIPGVSRHTAYQLYGIHSIASGQ